MATILNPQAMQRVLTHSSEYRRAVGLLNEDWDPDSQPIYRDVLEAADVHFARQLQVAGLIDGTTDLDDYRAVNQLIMRHGQWFSASARQALLAPFQD
ncbi:hypothetical protein [Limosilactobacillus sp.]|jgi:hypothetical protein|uniref:hypothetical protein n=1 Tax=Limosilactobacillus sp. TaxID=2773925 RepID=UPI0035A0BF5E